MQVKDLDSLFLQVDQIDKFNAESFANFLRADMQAKQEFITDEELEFVKEVLYVFSAYVRLSSLK